MPTEDCQSHGGSFQIFGDDPGTSKKERPRREGRLLLRRRLSTSLECDRVRAVSLPSARGNQWPEYCLPSWDARQ